VADQEAGDLFQKLLDGDPEVLERIVALAEEDQQEALALAKRLAEALEGPDADTAAEAAANVEAVGPLIAAAVRGEEPRIAIRLSDAVLARHPDDHRILSLRGQAHAELEEWEPAIADYSAALKVDPSLADVYNRRGVAYEMSGRPKEALADYEEVVRLHPDHAVGYRNRADAQITLGEPALAEQNYSEALRLQPGDPDILLLRARSRLELERLEDAEQDLQASAAAGPPNPDRQQLAGYLLLFKGDRHASRGQGDQANDSYRGALQSFDSVLGSDPQRVLALLGRAKARRVLGDLTGAVADFTEASRLDPRNAEIAMERGLVLEAQGQHEEALAAYEEAVRLAPENAIAHRCRGGAHAALAQLDQAEQDYSTAIRLAPRYVDARLARAAVRMLKDDLEGSIEDLDEALGIDPLSLPARTVRGRALARQWEEQMAAGEAEAAAASFQRALEDFDEQVRLAPGNPQAYVDRALLRGRMGDTARAIDDFAAALEVDPDFVPAISGRGIVHEIEGRYEEARKDYERAVELDPGTPTNHINLGDARAALAQWDEAVRAYAEAIDLDPKLPQAYMGRGKALAGQGEHRRALQDFDAFLALSPERVEGYVARGDAFQELAELDRAMGDYGRALQIDPDHDGALRGRIVAALAQADDFFARGLTADANEASEQAVAFCGEAVSKKPTDPALYRYRALALWRLEAFDAAIEDFGAAIERTDPEDATWLGIMRGERAEALRLWGTACGLKDKVREAVAGFEEALTTLPPSADRTWILEAQGEALAYTGDDTGALASYEASLAAAPGRTEALQGAGVMRYALGQHEGAREAFQAVLDATEGTDPTPRVGLGLSLEALERRDEAEAALRAALVGEAEVDAYTQRANAFTLFRLPERALSERVQAVLSSPLSPVAHNELAWHYVEYTTQPGLLWEAVLHAAAAVELDEGTTSKANFLDTLGWAHYLLEDAESAAKYLEQALEISPRPVDIRHHLERAREALSAKPAEARS
jgi:tetratricopeptide (TPR) repeat protein